jgi:trimethylamine--corrinoid protein Co-methyltransferase
MPQYKVLSDAEVEAIHQATLRVLAETGIFLDEPEAVERLAGAGGEVAGARVRLPPELVEAQLAACPSQVKLRGRGGQTKVLGDGSLSWHNLGGRATCMRRAAVNSDRLPSRTCATAPACWTRWSASPR